MIRSVSAVAQDLALRGRSTCMPTSTDDRVEVYLELARAADTILVAHVPAPVPDGGATVTEDQFVER